MANSNFLTVKSICTSIAFVLAGVAFQNKASAQNAGCNFEVDNTKWFTGGAVEVHWSPSGTKIALDANSVTASGKLNTNADHFIGNASDTSTNITKDVLMSKNLGIGGSPDVDLFTPNGGYIMGANNTYVKPSGGTVSIPGCGWVLDISRSTNRDTTVILAYDNASTVNNPVLKIVNDANPESPVFSNVPYSQLKKIVPSAGIATMENRIYFVYSQNLPTSDDATTPHRIKCIDFAGNTCPNWNDVIISTGSATDIQIRPTDSLIFARVVGRGYGSSGGQQANAGGAIIFNKNGVLASGFNFGDMNLMSGSGIIRFDAAGNIFANIGVANFNSTGYIATSQVGIVKFDPHGNLDYGFYSNMLKNYIDPRYSYSTYFDVNPVTGMIASGLVQASYGGNFHAKLGGEYVPGNNLNWWENFPDDGLGGAASNVLLGNDPGYNSGYNTLHFYYNNGKLKVDGESLGNSSANCGPQPPVVVDPPTANPAQGAIQCNSLACIPAPTQGAASTVVMKVAVNVDVIGTFHPVTVFGSGLTLQDPNISFNATHTGLNEFYVTLIYDGTTALGQFNINVGGAGSCAIDLSDHTKSNPSVIDIWTPENCTYKVIGPDLH